MEAVAPDRQLAGRYRLLEQIGAGGMATVWRADDSVLARPVAVKVLHAHLAESGDLLERFRREAVAAARLAHPNLVRVYDAGTDDGCAFIVMELVPGRTLADVIGDGVMDPRTAVDVTMAVLSALDCAHAAGIVHRDVKPGNILIAPDGLVKVTDFGLAPAFDATDLETTGEMLGTVAYVAPEQIQGGDVTPATDVYATGLVLYELLTGRRAFTGETDLATAFARLTTRPPAPSAMRPGLPRGIDQVVERATAPRPEQRYSSAGSMRAALERFGGSPGGPPLSAPAPTGQRPAGAPPAPGRGSLRGWMLVPIAVVLVAAAVIAGALALGRLSLGGPLGIRAAEPTTSAPPATHLRELPIVAARDEDPLGRDHTENPGTVALAVDGDPDSAWSTEHYTSAAFGNLKTGVGLWIDFGSSSGVRTVTITTLHPGWTFQLYSNPDAEGSPLVAADGHASTFTAKEGVTTVSLEPTRTRGILIWITGLVPDGDGFAATIADVSAQGTG